MFRTDRGDVILWASIEGGFHVLDASTRERVAGPLPLSEALSCARQHGDGNIFRQAVDLRGRVLSDPALLAKIG